ncbi:MAG: hypothetical protein E6I26_08670 [Chloroflexi bacterium]|nr:MAG: hypothetical protein E6I26_08670 [Chloroflexota bacterium]
MSRFLRRIVLTIVWLALVAVIAIGGAGLVTTMSNQPGTPARAELTADGDKAAQAGLEAAAVDLVDLTADVDRLGELGRGALTALVDSDFATLSTSIADGQSLARSIEDRSAVIRQGLMELPGTGLYEPINWSPETRRRRDLALVAINATSGLEGAWVRLAAGSTTANTLGVLLTDHDKIAGQAAAQGRSAKYAAALKTLAQAQAKLAQAKTLRDALRDALANTIVDVTTLTQWIDRNDEYDKALAHLYKATIAAKGRITSDLKQAAIEERQAHDLLPSNTSGLVIILAEIGRGGLNQAVIGIEQTRAKLQAAVDELTAAPAASVPAASVPAAFASPSAAP